MSIIQTQAPADFLHEWILSRLKQYDYPSMRKLPPNFKIVEADVPLLIHVKNAAYYCRCLSM